jgi:alpha-beta hydrolase superfamily lysophospholipase
MRILVVALALLAGSVQAAAAGGAPPSLVSACGSTSGIPAHPLWLTTTDGVRLYSIEAGAGPTAAVLAHGGRSDLCEELDYAKTLLDSGLRVIAFDFRGNGRSGSSSRAPLALGRDLAAAVAEAHKRGAANVFLIGSSMGGAAAVQNGAGLPVAGVISLSGTRLWAGYGINKPGPRALRAPLLYIGSRDDWRAPLKEAVAVFREAGSKDKRTAFYPGSLHGWQLVEGAPRAASTRALILAWIRAHA